MLRRSADAELPLLASAAEGLRNLRSSGVRGALLFLVMLLIFATSTTIDGAAVSTIVKDAEEFRTIGGYVLVVSAESPDAEGARLRASECERLSQLPGVVASGSMDVLAPQTLRDAPGVRISTIRVSRGALDLLGGLAPALDRQTAGSPVLLAGDALADELALQPGRTVSLAQLEPAPLTSVVATRSAVHSRALLILGSSDDDASSCWVETSPRSFGAVQPIVGRMLSTKDSTNVTRPLVDSGNELFAYDPVAELDQRPSRWLPLATGGLSVLVSLLWAWTRRPVLGMYRAMSLGSATVAAILGTELAAILVGSWVSAQLISVAYIAGGESLTWPTVAYVMQGSTVALCSAGAGVLLAGWLATRGSVMDQLKDR